MTQRRRQRRRRTPLEQTQSNETPANTETADSEPSGPSQQPVTESIDTAATQSASSNPQAETGEQNADHEPSVAQSEPAASVSPAQSQSQDQSQEDVAEPEAQSEPEQGPPSADNEPQGAAEQSHVTQAPATNPEEEQTPQPAQILDTSGFVTTQQDGHSGVDVAREETADPLQGSETDQSTDQPPIEGLSYTWQNGEHKDDHSYNRIYARHSSLS